MSVYGDVIAWSTNLPLWQRDALRRLATQTSLTPADIDSLTAACNAESNEQTANPASNPIDNHHVPSSPGNGSPVAISGISACQCLNAIPDGQGLTFCPAGLTIVYGDNGTGKSGFARVLRNACHARGAAVDVLPDVYAEQPGRPGASVQYHVNGSPQTFSWSQGGGASPEELRAVAIFDSVAAVALIEKENEVLWTPGGLDLLVRLAAVVDEVRGRLQQQVSAVSTPVPLPQVPTGTTVSAFLEHLSASTTMEALDTFVLKPEEQEELKRLDAALSTPDPAAAATQMRQRAQRFRALRDKVIRLEQGLGQAAIQELERLRSTYKTTVEAEGLLATQTFGDSQIPGVGGNPWRALWDAAESFALSGATPDQIFPSTNSPALCLLCQQPLSDTARGRLERFRSFVCNEIAQQRTAAADALRQKLQDIRNLRARESADDALLAELVGLHAESGQNLIRVLDAANLATSAIAGLVPESTEWRLPEPVPSGWAAWLDTVIAETERQAAEMQGATDPAKQAANHNRRNELLARQAICVGRSSIEAEIQRLFRRAALERATASCVTTGITRKAGELTRIHVTDRLMASFDEEAKDLRLPVTVKYSHSHNEKGTSFQKVVLGASAWADRVGGPLHVLSEGERRGVALAAFLAELATREDQSGVFFDDPVSSLDHDRRHIVAKRLAKLASERQVVVFTHDLVFLHMLKSAAAESGVAITDREVRRTATGSGLCRDKPPAKAMRVKALVGELKDRQQICATAHRSGQLDEYEAQLTNTFGLLREGWERAVEELLLNQAVMRFDHRVQTQRLKNLHDITQSDLDEIDAGMSVCSKWLPGHALAPAINEPLPDPSALLAEIQRLERFTQEMRKRGRS